MSLHRQQDGPGIHTTTPPTTTDKSRDSEKQAIDGNTKPSVSAFKNLGLLDGYLAVWIFLAMAIGIVLGNFVPQTGPSLQKGKFVGVSVPIGLYQSLRLDSSCRDWANNAASSPPAVGLLVMMYPILCKVRYESLHELLSRKGMWKQICFSLFVNWILAPFLMVGAHVQGDALQDGWHRVN